MELSRFGEKLSACSGILELMEDLGQAMQSSEKIYMLGGGNPAHIPEVNAIWRKRMQEILAQGDEFERMMANYDTPQGRMVFLEALAELLNREFGWPLTAKNIGITNGSQSAFFFLFNSLAGEFKDSRRKKILFPLSPEYIGYADQSLAAEDFRSIRSRIEQIDRYTFKYHIDFDRLEISNDTGAVCVSRPTNPTGNVLTDEEIRKLDQIAREAGVPLLIDNAYGTPFPQILFRDVTPLWNENIILSMSLSKLGLPSTRTGIIVAREEVIKTLSGINAVTALSCGSIGQVITEPLIRNGEILRISENIVKPFYQKKSLDTIRLLREAFPSNLDYSIHVSEGALFLWVWFKNLSINTKMLYERLKKRNVLIIPGHYFFYGLEEPWDHSDQCIRLTYSQNEEDVRRGIEIIAAEVKGLVC